MSASAGGKGVGAGRGMPREASGHHDANPRPSPPSTPRSAGRPSAPPTSSPPPPTGRCGCGRRTRRRGGWVQWGSCGAPLLLPTNRCASPCEQRWRSTMLLQPRSLWTFQLPGARAEVADAAFCPWHATAFAAAAGNTLQVSGRTLAPVPDRGVPELGRYSAGDEPPPCSSAHFHPPKKLCTAVGHRALGAGAPRDGHAPGHAPRRPGLLPGA